MDEKMRLLLLVHSDVRLNLLLGAVTDGPSSSLPRESCLSRLETPLTYPPFSRTRFLSGWVFGRFSHFRVRNQPVSGFGDPVFQRHFLRDR